MPRTPPGFSPPVWPRLGASRGDTGVSTGLPPVPVEIPLCWLTSPVRLRLEKPLTTAAVSRVGHGTAYDSNGVARADQQFTATLDTACSADPSVLASWTVTYRAEARTRSPELILDLMHRTDAERVLILSIQRNQRIRITGVPPNFPEGADQLIVSGITDEIGVFARRVRFTTRPVVGTDPGIAGPWFRVGTSAVGGTHIIPF